MRSEDGYRYCNTRGATTNRIPRFVRAADPTAIPVLYQRLLIAGKPKKLALTACMRKLLTILAAMAKTHKRWQAPEALTTA